MARVFAEMVLGVLLFGLLVVGAHTVRLTPEVLDCDRGRQRVVDPYALQGGVQLMIPFVRVGRAGRSRGLRADAGEVRD